MCCPLMQSCVLPDQLTRCSRKWSKVPKRRMSSMSSMSSQWSNWVIPCYSASWARPSSQLSCSPLSSIRRRFCSGLYMSVLYAMGCRCISQCLRTFTGGKESGSSFWKKILVCWSECWKITTLLVLAPTAASGSMEIAHGEVKVPSVKALLLRECSRMVKTTGPYANIICNRKVPLRVRRTTFANWMLRAKLLTYLSWLLSWCVCRRLVNSTHAGAYPTHLCFTLLQIVPLNRLDR